MEFFKLMENSQALENAITALINSNKTQESQLNELRTTYLNHSQANLDKFTERELDLKHELNGLKNDRDLLEVEVKHLTEINEKLNSCVSASQTPGTSLGDVDNRDHEIDVTIANIMQEYEQVRFEHDKISKIIDDLSDSLWIDVERVAESIKNSNELVSELHKNDRIIKVLAQQNKHGEQQFDLILQQIPWEPLTNLTELRGHDDQQVSAMAEVLQIQSNEINELMESLNQKKQTKLRVLNQLNELLDKFIRMRNDAMLIEGHRKSSYNESLTPD